MQTPISRTQAIVGLAAVAGATVLPIHRTPAPAATGKFTVAFSDDQWRKRLAPEAYDVLRHAGTEAPFSSPLDHEVAVGTYACAGCNLAVYSSKTKYDSGTGWPSFFRPLPHAIETSSDSSIGAERTEVHCRRCGVHLGHVFDDGPQPTGLRYCMNGVAMQFYPEKHPAGAPKPDLR